MHQPRHVLYTFYRHHHDMLEAYIISLGYAATRAGSVLLVLYSYHCCCCGVDCGVEGVGLLL